MSEKKSESASTSSQEFAKISAEIDGAVEMAVNDASTEAAKTAKPTGAEAPAETVVAPKETPAEPVAFEAGDADIERAVKCGLSVADAKAFKDKAAFERVCEALEKKNAPAEQPATPTSKEEKPVAENPDEDIEVPTLPTDEDYDPKLVAAFNKMGEMLKGAIKENRELKKAGHSAEAQSFFDTQFGAIDEGVRSKVDDALKAKLKTKFETLEAGYKAVKADITREAIFEEAATLTFGDLYGAAAAESRVAKIEGRKSLRLAPPSGANRSGTPQKSEDDIEKDVARLVSDKFNI